jgi:hypothetical protein
MTSIYADALFEKILPQQTPSFKTTKNYPFMAKEDKAIVKRSLLQKLFNRVQPPEGASLSHTEPVNEFSVDIFCNQGRI